MAKVTVFMPGGETWVSGDHARVFMGEEFLEVETKHRSTRFPLMNVLYWSTDKEDAEPSAKLMGQLHTIAHGPEVAEEDLDDTEADNVFE